MIYIGIIIGWILCKTWEAKKARICELNPFCKPKETNDEKNVKTTGNESDEKK